jgi:hypothetical protein
MLYVNGCRNRNKPPQSDGVIIVRTLPFLAVAVTFLPSFAARHTVLTAPRMLNVEMGSIVHDPVVVVEDGHITMKRGIVYP